MSLILQNRIFKRDNESISTETAIILRYLAQKGDDNSNGKYKENFIINIYPDQDTIADWCLLTRGTVNKHIGKLVAIGILVFVKCKQHGNKQYEIDLTKLEEYLVPVSDVRLPTSDVRLSNKSGSSDVRLPTSDVRLPTSDVRLPDTTLLDPLLQSFSYTGEVDFKKEVRKETEVDRLKPTPGMNPADDLLCLSRNKAYLPHLRNWLDKYNIKFEVIAQAIIIVESFGLHGEDYHSGLSKIVYALNVDKLSEDDVREKFSYLMPKLIDLSQTLITACSFTNSLGYIEPQKGPIANKYEPNQQEVHDKLGIVKKLDSSGDEEAKRRINEDLALIKQYGMDKFIEMKKTGVF
jgi:DNA-binding MarR family transcriptional regulator